MSLLTEDRTETKTGEFVRLSSGLRHHFIKTEGQGHPVLFIHGFLDSSYSFDALIRSWPRPVRSYSIDLRGHGQSEQADRYDISDFTTDAIEFIDRVIGSKVIVVGHSLGSIIAQRLAAVRPHLVEKLVLIGATPTAAGHPGLAELRDEVARFGNAIPRSYVDAFQRSTVYTPIGEAALARYIDESVKVSTQTWRGALKGLVEEPISHVQKVDVPTLVIWGAHDGVFRAADQDILGDLLPRGRLFTYPDAGHAPHWEFPARVARDIEAFLSERPRDA
jgi:pimeloyl-ACP methyl ester carboxylesterase